MNDYLTNDFVDNELVKRGGGWDVNKKHTVRLRDEIQEILVPYWHQELPKCDEREVSDIGGTFFFQTEPHIEGSEPVSQGGRTNWVTRHYDGWQSALSLARKNGGYFFFDQRFIIAQPEPDAPNGLESFSLAIRANGHFSGGRHQHGGWSIGFDAIKMLDCRNRSEEIAKQAAVRKFLLFVKLSTV